MVIELKGIDPVYLINNLRIYEIVYVPVFQLPWRTRLHKKVLSIDIQNAQYFLFYLFLKNMMVLRCNIIT